MRGIMREQLWLVAGVLTIMHDYVRLRFYYYYARDHARDYARDRPIMRGTMHKQVRRIAGVLIIMQGLCVPALSNRFYHALDYARGLCIMLAASGRCAGPYP